MKYRTDIEELELLPFAISKCQQHRVAIDGGANIGNWTQRLQQTFERVHSFEPVKPTWQTLEKRFLNSPKVATYQNALWDRSDQEIFMASPRGRTTSTSFYATTKEKHSSYKVWTIAIDSFHLTNLDLLKLDLEGGELRALVGAEQTIHYNRPVIVVECVDKQLNRYGDSVRSLHAWLLERRYAIQKQHLVNRVYAYE